MRSLELTRSELQELKNTFLDRFRRDGDTVLPVHERIVQKLMEAIHGR